MILWHEGITGRNQEELTSTFHKFLLQNRDSSKITIWLDYCTSQNKNWCLLTFLVYIINSSEISTKEINFHNYEPGHSFMSTDSFHHQVELLIKRSGKLYDFSDYVKAVSKANDKHVQT